MSIYWKCAECGKDVTSLKYLSRIKLSLSYPRFSEKGTLEEYKYTRHNFETESICKTCSEKVTGNLQERLSFNTVGGGLEKIINKIVSGLFKLKCNILRKD